MFMNQRDSLFCGCAFIGESWSDSVEFSSEELFGDDGVADAIGESIEGFVLIFSVFPADGVETVLHDFAIEVEAFSDLHN